MWSTHAAHGSRPQTRTPKSNSESTTAFGIPNMESSSRTHPVASQHQYTVSSLEADSFADFLEPAVDGPPSPAIIRAFNDKVKKASVSERHVSPQISSSSISYAPFDRRPSWEQTLESFSLSRKSSVKSTTSSMPSKDRPESVQAIGKAIFNRKAKLRRESLTPSTGSTHSAEPTPDLIIDRSRAASSVSKDHILATMSIFSRRKTLHAGEDASAQKKPMISSPFNFQHVAQIHRDQLPILELGDRVASEMAGVRTPPALGENLRVPNFSSGTSRPRDEEESVPPDMVVHKREDSGTRTPNIHKAHPRQWVKQTKSQDQIRGARPPRPPRSPTELNVGGYFDYAPPVVPARNASRPSIPRRDSEALGNMGAGRQRSISNARFPAPHLPVDAERPASPVSSAESSPFTQERRFSRIFMPADNPNWPLSAPLNNNSMTTFETALPEVPEEEEQSGVPPGSRHSNKSANSSLKGSVSVPALRKASLSNASYASSHDRSYCRDSAVLGPFDMTASRQISEADIAKRAQIANPLRRDSWEAVIDYCYEHEMEADCDYDWHRPSVELDQEPTVLVTESDTGLSRPPSDCIEVPILSPPSHDLSPQSSQELFTPRLTSGTKSPTNANFSLPRRERPQRLLHVRNESQISFTEAQGFSLSPSFLIPTDYHHELLAAQTQKYQDPESIAQAATLEEPNVDLFQSARASASTLASNGNLSSRSVFERHISSTSTNTDYTRLTMSISSVDMERFNFKDDAPATTFEDQEPELPDLPLTHARSRSAAGLLGTATSPSLTPGLSRDTHGSDPNLGRLHSPKQNVAGRARSRTLSSTPGNFSLFRV